MSIRDLENISGIDRSKLSRIENGLRKKPNILVLSKLSAVLDLVLDDLAAVCEYIKEDLNFVMKFNPNVEQLSKTEKLFLLNYYRMLPRTNLKEKKKALEEENTSNQKVINELNSINSKIQAGTDELEKFFVNGTDDGIKIYSGYIARNNEEIKIIDSVLETYG